jgi:hypothetical protein
VILCSSVHIYAEERTQPIRGEDIGYTIKMAIILGVSIMQGIFRHDFSKTGTVFVHQV